MKAPSLLKMQLPPTLTRNRWGIETLRINYHRSQMKRKETSMKTQPAICLTSCMLRGIHIRTKILVPEDKVVIASSHWTWMNRAFWRSLITCLIWIFKVRQAKAKNLIHRPARTSQHKTPMKTKVFIPQEFQMCQVSMQVCFHLMNNPTLYCLKWSLIPLSSQTDSMVFWSLYHRPQERMQLK